MRRFLRRRDKGRRSRQRGAVAVEFALSLVFLVPLLLGTLDYGYYFWVGVNAVEAARAGARAAINTAGLSGCPSVATATAEAAAATLATTAVNTQLAKVFGSAANAALVTSTPTNGCMATPPINPTWRIQVQVDFPPAVGFLNPWMPASTKTTGYVRYKTAVIATSP